MLSLLKRRLEFVPPYVDRAAGEWIADADLAVPAYMRRVARERPLLWTVAPPRRVGNYYVRKVGESEYAFVRVQPCECGGADCRGVVADVPEAGLEWFGPLPDPPR